MKLIDVLSLSTRMFRTRPMRTFLTILGVSIGIGAVLFLVSLGYGLQNVVLGRITTADSLLSLDVSPGNSGLISLNNNSIARILEIKEVAEVSPLAELSAQLSLGKLTGDGLVFAIDPSYFRLSGISPKDGETFSSDKAHEAVISSASAKMFDINENRIIGQEISLVLLLPDGSENNEAGNELKVVELKDRYRIVGVIEDENANFIYIPRKSLAGVEIDDFSSAKIKVVNSDLLESVRNQVIDQGFLVSSLNDTVDQAKKIFRVIQIVLSLFGLVALAVSAIGTFNTMTIALLERINEIGIMRSIGITKKDIRLLFLFESVIIGFLGGLFGVIIGFATGEVANFGINILAKNLGGEALNLFYRPPWFILVIIIFSTFVGLLTGIYPSLKASKLNPLDALRYK